MKATPEMMERFEEIAGHMGNAVLFCDKLLAYGLKHSDEVGEMIGRISKGLGDEAIDARILLVAFAQLVQATVEKSPLESPEVGCLAIGIMAAFELDSGLPMGSLPSVHGPS